MAKLRSTLLTGKRLQCGVTAGKQYLTGLDIFNGHVGIPIILVYKNGIDLARAEQALVETLKRYPIICGRYRKDAEGHAYVDSNDAGIEFNVHRAEGPLPYGPHKPLGSDIHKFYKMLYLWQVFKDMPLLKINIYQYEDGGVVMSFYGPHSLFDGSAFWGFMADWSRAMKGEEIKGQSFDREEVIKAGLTGVSPEGYDLVYDPTMGSRLGMFARLLWNFATDMRKEVFRIPAGTVQRWKDQVKAELPGSAGVSTVELITAYCMKVFSPLMPRGVPRSVGIVLDLRHKRRLRIPRDYFGNALCYGEAFYTEQELAEQSMPVLAEKCRPQAEQVSTESLFKLLTLMEQYRQRQAIWRLFFKPAKETLSGGMILNNCTPFPMYDIDLGKGTPDWYDICPVMFRMLMVVPTPEKDGGMDLHITAPKRELKALREALRRDGIG
jgi:shikimate O-hydroxycinnamoyltransferase